MKKTIVSLAAMIIVAISVNAQQPNPTMKQPHQQHFKHHGRGMLAKKLNFSDQQKEQLKNINSDYHKKIMDLKKHDEITVKEFKSQMGALRKDQRAQIQALLTTEQKDQLAKMKQDRMEKAKSHAVARAKQIKTKLGLTDTQSSQLKDLRAATMTKIKSIHADNALSREQKQGQIKSLVMQQKDQLKTILTADQLEQLQQMKSQHHRRDFSK